MWTSSLFKMKQILITMMNKAEDDSMDEIRGYVEKSVQSQTDDTNGRTRTHCLPYLNNIS